MSKTKKNPTRSTRPDWVKCPKCGRSNNTATVARLQVDMRPVLSEAVTHFPEALAEVSLVGCLGCGYRICLDYSVALDDNPELDLNERLTSECG